MMTRFHLPEPGLSRTGRWCLGGSFLLILGFFFVAGIWMPVWRIAEITGTNPRIDPPLSTKAEGHSCEADRVLVSVSRDARSWRRSKPLDPADLEATFREAISRYDRKCRMEGRSSTEEVGDGVRLSKLTFAVRADRAAPWGAVHDVLRRAGEAGLYRIEFLARPPDVWTTRWLWAYLPLSKEPRAAITIGVRRGPDGAAVYSLAGADAPDPAVFRQKLTALYKQADESEPRQRITAKIDAARDMPFEAVVRALDELTLSGFWSFHLETDGLRAEVR